MKKRSCRLFQKKPKSEFAENIINLLIRGKKVTSVSRSEEETEEIVGEEGGGRRSFAGSNIICKYN